MKATITSTKMIVEMKDAQGRSYSCRVWEGATEDGAAFTAYIGRIQVAATESSSEFDADLSEHSEPSTETKRAIDHRFG